MKYTLVIFMILAASACASSKFLIDKRGCEEIGPDYIHCPENSVHKVK